VHRAPRDRVREGADEAAVDNTDRVVGGLVCVAGLRKPVVSCSCDYCEW
jgi:hypothetical protein